VKNLLYCDNNYDNESHHLSQDEETTNKKIEAGGEVLTKIEHRQHS
jgi:hypothetical protein